MTASLFDYWPFLAYYIAVSALFGAAMGSFLNCAAWRIIRGESFIRGRSRCPSCGHVLGPAELVPVFGWVALRGRCRWCRTRIPVRYPLTEMGFALVTVCCALRFGLTLICLRNYVFLCCLFLLSLTDLEGMLIPDGCHIVSVLAWVAALPFSFPGWSATVKSILAGASYGMIFLVLSLLLDRILGKESLGGGDIKLFAVTGLYLGWIGTLFVILISCLAGLLFQTTCGRKAGDKGAAGKAFPFGPWIAMAAAVMLLFGQPAVTWYLGLLGL